MISRSIKVAIPITTRGNYAKLKILIQGLQQTNSFSPFLILAGALVKPECADIKKSILYQLSDIPITAELDFLVLGDGPDAMAASAARAANMFAEAFRQNYPDLVIILADRYECLAITMSAVLMNIPIAHIEGGEVSGSIDESIRHAITKLAHLHFPATHEAGKRICNMGEPQENIDVVGATSLDVITNQTLRDFNVLQSVLVNNNNQSINLSKPYLLVIQHPVTTEYNSVKDQIEATILAVTKIALARSLAVIWIAPNADAGQKVILDEIYSCHGQERFKPLQILTAFTIEHYGPVLAHASCLVGNSSSGIREASFLGTPVVNIGTRQAGRERAANVLDVPHNRELIQSAIETQINHGRYDPSLLYGDGQASMRIINRLSLGIPEIQKKIRI